MEAVPGAIPATTPVVAPTVATVVKPLVQEPPVIDDVRVLVVPVQMPVDPEMTGTGLIDINLDVVQVPIE